MQFTNLATSITALQKNSIISWKAYGCNLSVAEQIFFNLVEENHAFNFKLWHAEDDARLNNKGYEFVFRAKRAIDNFNQQRNNFMEAMDKWLFEKLQPAPLKTCPLNSETPGMMIDRLSILSLKIYHMNEQLERTDSDDNHHENCKNKLLILAEQHENLTLCLQDLINETLNKTRTFKIYYQCKMYNDIKFQKVIS